MLVPLIVLAGRQIGYREVGDIYHIQCVAKPASPPLTLEIVLTPVGQGAPGFEAR